MLANGSTRPSFPYSGTNNSSVSEETNTALKFAQGTANYSKRSKLSDDGLDSLTRRDQEILQELEEYIVEGPNRQPYTTLHNNNNTGFWTNKMATANTNGPSQALSNTNGFQLPIESNTSLQSKATPGVNLLSHMNNQFSDQGNLGISGHANPSSSLKMLPGGQTNPSLPPTNQYNQYSQRQEHLMRGFQGNNGAGSHDISASPLMRSSEQYTTPQRSYMSANNDTQMRSVNRQSPSPFSQNYFPQESHNTHSTNRTSSTSADDRGLSSSEHFPWLPNRYQTSISQTNSSISPAISRTQNPASPMPPRRPSYMGQNIQYPTTPPQQPGQPHPYMMSPSMKPMPQTQQYYNNMGMPPSMMGPSHNPMGMPQRQGTMANQVAKSQPDMTPYQQQQYQQRFPQPNYPPQLPPYMASRQSQNPNPMSRVPMQHHQPILPKPAVDMFGSPSTGPRYPSSVPDSSMDFPGPIIGDASPSGPPPLHRQPFPATGMPPDRQNQPQYSRGFPPFQSPLQGGSSSPNVTLGSPMRNLSEGFPGGNPLQGSGPVPPPAYPTRPSSNPPNTFPAESPLSHSGAAAAAAAALAAASSMTYPGMGPMEQSGPPSYGSQESGIGSRGSMGVVPSPRSGTPNLSMQGVDASSSINSVKTGRVPSPSLNQLPTAEDVETMIKMMGSGECLDRSPPSSRSSSPTTMSELNNGNHSGPATPIQTVAATSADSPMSTFSGLSVKAGITGLSSPSSSFGDDQDEDIPVDAITPTLTGAPLPSYNQDQSKPSFQQAKFALLYQLDDNPDRRNFLDKYASFMESSGAPVTHVPVINNEPLDLFKFYRAVRESGGLQEIVKKKSWDSVIFNMGAPLQLSNILRTQYARLLLSYEMKDSQGGNVDGILKNDLEDSGIPPPNAMVTCTEAIIPSASVTTSIPGDSYNSGYNHMNGPQGYNGPQTYEGHQEGYEGSKGFMNDTMDPRHTAPPQLPNMGGYNMPPYNMMGNERSSYPGYPSQSFQSAPNTQFTGAAALSQLAYQRNQQAMQGYPGMPPRRPSHMGQQAPMMSSPGPQDPMTAVWPGSQYNASSEPVQMFDYLPPGQSGRSMRPSMPQYPQAPPYNSYQSRQQYPPMPPYRPSSPHVQSSASPSMQRPQMVQSQGVLPQQLSPKPKYNQSQQHSGHMKREVGFPADCVEGTRPVFTKKRKLTSRDLGPVEAWRVMMSLKSGLLAETTWALDTLNILLYDENTVGYFVLSHLPGLLDNLLDHFRCYLAQIFGKMSDIEVGLGTAFLHKPSKRRAKPDEKKSPDEKLEEDSCRSLTAFIASASIDHPDEGFVSRARMWSRGGSDVTTHIQTHVGTATSPRKALHRKAHARTAIAPVEKAATHSPENDACQPDKITCSKDNVPCSKDDITCNKDSIACSRERVACLNDNVMCLKDNVMCSKDAVTCQNRSVTCPKYSVLCPDSNVEPNETSVNDKCNGANDSSDDNTSAVRKVDIKTEALSDNIQSINDVKTNCDSVASSRESRTKNECQIKTESGEKCESKCCAEDTWKGGVKLENCVSESLSKDWELDSDSSSEMDPDSDDVDVRNDDSLTEEERFTRRLKKELDLLIDFESDGDETDAYIESLVASKVRQDRGACVHEQECVRKEDAPLCLRTESDDAISRRCICVSNILRGLSFVPGNDIEMHRHAGLLLILGRLLLLYHEHAHRVPYKRTYLQVDEEPDVPVDDRDDWWWHCLEVLRENALVILSNIAGQLDLTFYSDTIRASVLEGLLHWLVCESADALDPMPTATPSTSLSAQQLVLEALAKMSILGGNAELIISTSSSPQLVLIHDTLVRLLGSRGNPVCRELTLVLLSNLSQSDNEFANLGDKKQCIAMLLQFIEDAANSINAYSSGSSLAQGGYTSEDFCGTSVDMLRRAASTLVCLSRCKSNKAVFLPFQDRLLVLTTLRLLDGMIGSHLADVLYYLSR
ncbi:AT-rich interactive domain-containing protein 1B [Nematostella vectensis]|uniref:AT-rich interactive domain-containing protein 1B n=1 Tax=Nematostella vectensis TaxID=45351 RepID=UPI0013903B04|nr:AT-rich interactive domain-containing protein 1B [Nematostella vectensis]